MENQPSIVKCANCTKELKLYEIKYSNHKEYCNECFNILGLKSVTMSDVVLNEDKVICPRCKAKDVRISFSHRYGHCCYECLKEDNKLIDKEVDTAVNTILFLLKQKIIAPDCNVQWDNLIVLIRENCLYQLLDIKLNEIEPKYKNVLPFNLNLE